MNRNEFQKFVEWVFKENLTEEFGEFFKSFLNECGREMKEEGKLVLKKIQSNLFLGPLTKANQVQEVNTTSPAGIKESPTRNKKMYDCDGNYNEVAAKKDYLETRAWRIKDEKVFELRQKFNMDNDPYPKTMKEFVKRIQDGKFVLEKRATKDGVEDEDNSFYFDPWNLRGLSWRDPSKVKDEAGYDKAREELDTRFTAIQDIIAIDTPENALKAIQEWEKETV